MNIIEDRRIEDLGTDLWKGYKSERLFKNAYFWALRDDVGELWSKLVQPVLDSGADPNEKWVEKRIARVRHEAFLQRLLAGKIKGGTNLPPKEWLKIDETARHVEEELKKLEKDKNDQRKVHQKLVELTQKVIGDLELKEFQPDVKEIGDTSWDKTFTQEYADEKGKNKRETEKEMDTYFDEIWKVEKVCPVCGEHFVKTYGVRKD